MVRKKLFYYLVSLHAYGRMSLRAELKVRQKEAKEKGKLHDMRNLKCITVSCISFSRDMAPFVLGGGKQRFSSHRR